MRFLRKNTAVIISVGPFFDATDGVTIETALTISNERITLVADTDDNSAPTLVLDNVTGATTGTANDLNYITGQDNGMMQLELSAANTNRNGRMLLTITDAANHVPVFHEFMVLDAAVFDALVQGPGTDVLDVNVTQALGTAITATGGRPEVNTTHVGGTSQTAGDIVADTNDIQSRLPTALVSGRIDAEVSASGFAQGAADKVWSTTARSLTTTPGIKKNTALAKFSFFMRDSADHISGKTGLTLTEEVSIDGAAFTALTNNAAEVANGVYTIDLAAADVNGNSIMLKFTGAGADPTFIEIVTDR